jgi:hypothetical protein
MSAPAIRAWNKVTRQQLEDALSRLHPDDRPSYDATVAVGLAVAVLTNGKKGYCDSTTRQLYDYLKGVYGESVIRNALWALQIAGVIVSVRGGTIGKDGKGRGAHRVFVDADTNGLIPDGYIPPPPRRDPPTGQDLSHTWDDSNTGNRKSNTSNDESDTGHDLSTPKESISSSTAALAGRRTTEDSLGRVVEQESPMPPRCETCSIANTSHNDVEHLARAFMADDSLMRGTSAAQRGILKKDAQVFARILLAHYPQMPTTGLAATLKHTMKERKERNDRLYGPARHDYVLDVAAKQLD